MNEFKNEFRIVDIVMVPKGIRPGDPGNAIAKSEGNNWGARITVRHRGSGGNFDFGWFAYLAEYMNTCISGSFPVDGHSDWTQVTVEVAGIWTNGTLNHGQTVGAEALVTTDGALSAFHGYNPKIQPRDIPGAMAWSGVRTVYQVLLHPEFEYDPEIPPFEI